MSYTVRGLPFWSDNPRDRSLGFHLRRRPFKTLRGARRAATWAVTRDGYAAATIREDDERVLVTLMDDPSTGVFEIK